MCSWYAIFQFCKSTAPPVDVCLTGVFVHLFNCICHVIEDALLKRSESETSIYYFSFDVNNRFA